MRFGLAYALVAHERVDSGSMLAKRSAWGLVARFEMSAPTGDHDDFAGERSGVYIPSLAGDFHGGRWRIGAEVGARIRPITELLGARVGTQLTAAVGVAYDLVPRELLTASVEAWALPSLVSQDPGQPSPFVPAEWQVAARTAPLRGGDLAIQLGGGSAIPFGGEPEITRPRFRFTPRRSLGAPRARHRRRRRPRCSRQVPDGPRSRHRGRLSGGGKSRPTMSLRVHKSERSRHLVLRVSAGEILPDALLALLGEEHVTCGWLRASGVLTDVELRAFDAQVGRPGSARRIAGPVQVLALESSIGLLGDSRASRFAPSWRERAIAASRRWPARSFARAPSPSRCW